MKRIALLAVLGIVSCTALDDPRKVAADDTLVPVTFSVDATKALPDAIAGAIPSSIDLTITNKATGSAVTAATGQTITIPVGDYSVTGTYRPSSRQNVIGTAVYLSKTPAVRVEQDVTIRSGVTSYPLAASVSSFVLAVDSSEASAWTMNMSSNDTAVDFIVDGTTWWVFCTGSAGDRSITTKVIPRDLDGHQTKTYQLSTSPSVASSQGWDYVEPRHWYWLHPDAIPTENAGVYLTFSDWTEGAFS